jgi:hypothetical protein
MTVMAGRAAPEETFGNVLMGENASHFEKCHSMEKLWLAFIMLEKYKKKWTEEGWVSL